MLVYLNGRYLPAERAAVPVTDRGFLYGDGVFESVRLWSGGLFRFQEHYERLAAGAELLRIPCPAAGELRGIAHQLHQRNGIADGSVRMLLTRGAGGRGLGTRGAGPPTLFVSLHRLAPDWRERARTGWTVITARIRHPPSSAAPQRLKGQGRTFSLLARIEAEEAGADEALLLSTDGRVAEGGTWNVFWRVGRSLRTPSPSVGILTGVTRAVVMGLARETGLEVEEGAWPREALDEADEMFATMSSSGLVAIRRLDRRTLGPGPDDVRPALSERYWNLVESEVRAGR